jgi:hypothetical protein
MRKALEWLGGSVLVYVLMAACAGAPGATADRRSPDTSAEGGADGAVAAGGVPNVPTTGGEPSPGEAGLGGVLDPVPPAMAAGTGGGGAPGSGGGGATYTERSVECTGQLLSNGTKFPAAIVELDPPSLLRAAQVLAVTKSTIGDADGPWMVAGSGTVASPDGSKVGYICAKATDTVTVFVPN